MIKNTLSEDEKYMSRALSLARRGRKWVSPNPMVGAVIVNKGRVISEGYHHHFGGAHAEIDALGKASENVAGATMYVTLEPCHHYGKTPPCVDALIERKLGRVVVGMIDPDPRTAGKSVQKMRDNGIKVTTGVLEDESRALNEAYIRHRVTGLPLVTLKFAQSLDARIATATGSSAWITSEESRRRGHLLRASHDAILVGVGTILADDPELTVRHVRGKNPLRVVLDSSLKTPPGARVVAGHEARTLIVTASGRHSRADSLCKEGVEVLELPAGADGKIDLSALLRQLGERDITSVLVEGGAAIHTSFLRHSLADRFVAFIAPRVMGAGIETVGDLGITDVAGSIGLTFDKLQRSGPDIMIEGRFKRD